MASWNVTDGSYKGLSFHVAVPKTNYASAYGLTSQSVTDERRLQISEKPLVDGAEVEDFGRKPRMFSAEVIFFGSDYAKDLKAFQDKLNEGTTGVLILPDLNEAVNAKFQRSTRRTSASDGNATMLSVAWVEDISKEKVKNPLRTQEEAQAALASGNQVSALPTVADQANTVSKAAQAASNALTNNPILKAISAAENAVTTSRVTINSVLNVPKNTRSEILSATARVNGEIAGLQSAVEGIKSYVDNLGLGLTQSSPTRYNTGLGQSDYKSVDQVSTTVVGGSQQVVVKAAPVQTPIASFPEAIKKLQDKSDTISKGKAELEAKTMGSTSDFTKSVVQLVNAVADLIAIISPLPTKQVLTTSQTSLIEICFENGLTVNDIEAVQKKNTFLTDILDVPRFTVINI
jgi:prophage DNA circulation protein